VIYRVLQATGVLVGADYRPSPHQDDRPDPQALSLLVIHGISLPPGQFGGEAVSELFLGNLDSNAHPYYRQLVGVRVSAHLWIRRSGEVVQFVPFHCRAWHAGVSKFGQYRQCNDFSIGIELEGTDTCPYTDAQYEALTQVIHALRQAYPSLASAPIVGHADIAPLRKTDPGSSFDWEKLKNPP